MNQYLNFSLEGKVALVTGASSVSYTHLRAHET